MTRIFGIENADDAAIQATFGRVRSVGGSRQRAQAGWRLIISCPTYPLDWKQSTCSRTRGQDGTVYEYVIVHGGLDGVSDEELDKWIQTFPIS
jgi:hypothetical protein